MDQTNNFNFNYKVYCIFSAEDPTVLVGLDIKIVNDTIKWFDTIKERIMRIDKILDPDTEHFIFKRKDGNGGVYTLIPMTLELYKEKAKENILMPKDFLTIEEMLRFFEETKNNAWQ